MNHENILDHLTSAVEYTGLDRSMTEQQYTIASPLGAKPSNSQQQVPLPLPPPPPYRVEGGDWAGVKNLDTFFADLYMFYREGGLRSMMATRIVNLVTIAFTVCFSVFLCAFVDWKLVSTCESAKTCKQFHDYLILPAWWPWNNNKSEQTSLGFLDYAVLSYVIVFLVFWLWSFLSLFPTFRTGLQMRQFCIHKLGLLTRDVQTMEWSEIAARVVALQESGGYRIQIDGNELTAKSIALRLMRKENYLIAMINHGVLPFGINGGGFQMIQAFCGLGVDSTRSAWARLRKSVQRRRRNNAVMSSSSIHSVAELIPGFGNHSITLDGGDNITDTNSSLIHQSEEEEENQEQETTNSLHTKPKQSLFTRIGGQSSTWFFGRAMEYNLYLTIFNHMFAPNSFRLRRSFVNNPEKLKRRFVLIGILNLILMPFIIGFMTIYLFLRFAEEFYSKKQYLGPRWWSPYATWHFREFNELPHLLDRRLYAGLPHAERYLKQFPTAENGVLASGISFMSGAIVAVLLLLALVDESILLHVHIGDRNLLWYTAIFSSILAISRALVPHREEMINSPNVEMRVIASYTHYLPDRWIGLGHTYDVRDDFLHLYQYKASLFLREMISIIMAPFILCVVLPHYTDDIIGFVRRYTHTEDGVGDVCLFSLLKLNENGDPRYGSTRVFGNSHDRMFDGKLEKSWLSFYVEYGEDVFKGCEPEERTAGHALLRDLFAHDQEQKALIMNQSQTQFSSKTSSSKFMANPAALDGEPERIFYMLDDYHEKKFFNMHNL